MAGHISPVHIGITPDTQCSNAFSSVMCNLLQPAEGNMLGTNSANTRSGDMSR